MDTPKSKAPPAVTEGADTTSAGKQEQVKGEPADAQLPEFWEGQTRDVIAASSQPPPVFDLVTPPGLVGELVTYINDSARYPMMEGAMMAALGLMAGIAGRHFNFGGTGLNLYLLLLAESGRGKEDMDSGIERMLTAVRLNVAMVDQFMGPNTFASGQALIRALEKKPGFLSIQGEFGLRLKELNDPRAPSSTVVLRRVLLDLYAKSGWGKVLRPTAYSDSTKNTEAIHAPCVTILGESTPGHVFDNLTFRDIEDGLLPRSLILEVNDKRPRQNPGAGFPPAPELADRFAAFVGMCLTMHKNGTCSEVVATVEAAAALQEFQDYLDDQFNNEDRPAHDRALWNRAGLNVRRIAALLAVGKFTNTAPKPLIELADVQWAMDFVEHCVHALAYKFHEGIVGNGEERQEAEIRKYVREYVAMKPTKRQFTYAVPARLVQVEGCIGLHYLKKRARRCVAFTQDKRGFERTLSDTLAGMCRAGALYKLHPTEVHSKFGIRQEVYAIADLDAWQ